MIRIKQYLLERDQLLMPIAAQCLSISMTRGCVFLFAECHTDGPQENRKFFTVKTGDEKPIAAGKYLGSYSINSISFDGPTRTEEVQFFHVYEQAR